MNKRRYKSEDIDGVIVELSERFEKACSVYYNSLLERKSNRSLKELSKENRRGSKLHSFQADFAWVLHDIKMGPICSIEDNVDIAINIISKINKIASA